MMKAKFILNGICVLCWKKRIQQEKQKIYVCCLSVFILVQKNIKNYIICVEEFTHSLSHHLPLLCIFLLFIFISNKILRRDNIKVASGWTNPPHLFKGVTLVISNRKWRCFVYYEYINIDSYETNIKIYIDLC